jgi:hypothetical protein
MDFCAPYWAYEFICWQVQRMPCAMFISHRSGRSAGGPGWVLGQPPGTLVDTILGVVKGRKWMFHQYDGKMDGNILDYTFDYTLVYTYYTLLCHILGW